MKIVHIMIVKYAMEVRTVAVGEKQKADAVGQLVMVRKLATVAMVRILRQLWQWQHWQQWQKWQHWQKWHP